MLINLWYVVLPSAQLTSELAAVRLLGQPFVAFRDDKGEARLFDVCVHRGGSTIPLTLVDDAEDV